MGVFVSPQSPGGLKSASQQIFVGLGQTYMRRSHSAPSTRDWQKHVRQLRNEIMLLLR
jgi:hypothetical protein